MRGTTLGSALRFMRMAIGLRQCDIAQAVRVSPTLISRIENSQVLPTPDTLMDILEVLTRPESMRCIHGGTHTPVKSSGR